ncbi:hypothetical protein K438DRAFT_1789932 [Mycena galopus ATCC 62051]|nr:hypothetical protein K438DRAFT_1789932 [Mycena galopus ATCC 62051]
MKEAHIGDEVKTAIAYNSYTSVFAHGAWERGEKKRDGGRVKDQRLWQIFWFWMDETQAQFAFYPECLHRGNSFCSPFENLSSEKSGEHTNPSVTAAFVEHDTPGTNTASQSGPAPTSPASVIAPASTVSDSQTEKPAHPPRKRLKLGPLKRWGVQPNGVAADYAQND